MMAPVTQPQSIGHPTYRLPERLHSRSEYVSVQTMGRKFRGTSLLLIVGQAVWAGRNRAPRDANLCRMGYTVSRKVGNAVVRNRIKRQLKEAVRLSDPGLCHGFDHVVVAHPQAAAIAPQQLRQELTCLLERARRWAHSEGCATALLPCTG